MKNGNRKHTWEMIWMLAKTDLKMRYQGSWLGAIWIFLKPLCIFLVLNFVFSHLFFKNNPHYAVRLLIGLILWFFFSETTSVGMTSMIVKANILKKIFIPKWIIVISASVHSALAFFFNLVILFIFLIAYGIYPNPLQIGLFLVYVLLVYGISVTFSFFAAPMYVRLRDINQIWEVLLQVLFYASPIIYPISSVPASVQSILYINPMTLLIEHSKMVLIDNTMPRFDHLLIFIAIFIPVFLLSILYLRRSSKNLVELM